MIRRADTTGADLPDRGADGLLRLGVESPEPIASARDRFMLVGPPGGACHSFAAVLRTLGTVDVYADTTSALAGLQATCPQMILSDVLLPDGRDVFDFLRAVRADPRAQTAPVILCSTHEGDDAAALGLEGGASDYFGPGMSRREATARLRSHLRLARAQREEQARLQFTAGDLTDFFVRAGKLESIGVLAGGIAHDFNNILMAIVGNLSLVKLLVDPHGKVFQRIDESQRAAMRARSLTQQLLAFSKGGLPVRKPLAPVALEALVRESAQFALRGSNVDCEMSFPEPLWPVDADEGQVGQVIANLALNAQQAMPEGGSICVAGANVTLKTDEVPPLSPGDYVMISITDRGGGIAPEVAEKMFDPFFTTKSNGSGLGLTTSYWIARRHDGHITVKSPSGSGATVSLYLPRAESSEAPNETVPVVAPARRILLMDDDELVREVVSGMLKGLGCDVECSADGQEAVACFSRARANGRPFDAVILDLTVRDGMGGMEALERLKAIEPSVKAIVASGYSNAPIMADSEASGFCMGLAKPFSIEQLDQALARVVGSG